MFFLFHKNFVYQPLDTAANEIRLIKILPRLKLGRLQCQIEHFPFAQAPSYTALSYTWENPIPGRMNRLVSRKLIRAIKTALRIGDNLTSALQYFRRYHPLEYMWVDAICIDQANLAERGLQILRMARIYGAAQRIIVWLGPEYGDSSLALDFIRSLAEKYANLETEVGRLPLIRRYSLDTTHAKASEALHHLTSRTWWTRMWILQEMVVSRKVDLVCGDSLISWGETANVMNLITYCYPSFDDIIQLTDTLPEYVSVENVCCIVVLQPHFQSGSSLLLETCLFNANGFAAPDDRDYIYAVLALASDANALVSHPDYTMAAHDVYNTLVRSYIENYKSLDIIYIRSRPDFTSPLPSWVPNWTLTHEKRLWKNSLFMSSDDLDGFLQCAAASTVPLVSYSPDFKSPQMRRIQHQCRGWLFTYRT